MAHKRIKIGDLLVNSSNDRHGQVASEAAAIMWLFHNHDDQMRSLMEDIAKTGRLYEEPLVSPQNGKYLVLDGNRRVTSLKLLNDPRLAPNVKVREFVDKVRKSTTHPIPAVIECEVEEESEVIEQKLYRRHTGSQNGVGQIRWTGSAKANFLERTGLGVRANVAREMQKVLSAAGHGRLAGKMPLSTFNRLFSTARNRDRAGFDVEGSKVILKAREDKVIGVLRRVADDLARGEIVLKDLWSQKDKEAYLDKLDEENLLPTPRDKISAKTITPPRIESHSAHSVPVQPGEHARTTLIPGGLRCPRLSDGSSSRIPNLWHELQITLKFSDHPNAIAVLFRVLLELLMVEYAGRHSIAFEKMEKFSGKFIKLLDHMVVQEFLSPAQRVILAKFQHDERLISANTMNQYVHQGGFHPTPTHLRPMWSTLEPFILACFK